MTLYVGGVGLSKPSPGASPDSVAPLRIGCRGDDNNYFIGRIDEVQMYRRALSAAEIAALAK